MSKYYTFIFVFLRKALLGLDLNENCDFRFPSSYDVKKRIERTFQNFQTDMWKSFESFEWICITVDIWGTRHRSFLGITAHCLDSNTLERRSFALSCCRFPHPHTGDQITEQIQLVYALYKLTSSKVTAGIMDNAANFAKAFREYGSNHSEFEEYVECGPNVVETDGLIASSTEKTSAINEEESIIFPEVLDTTVLPNRITCSCHNFNLIGTKDSSEAQNDRLYSKQYVSSFRKLNKLWNKTQRSKTSETIQQNLHCSLGRPGNTRWNSVHTSVNQVMTKDPTLLDDLMSKLEIETFTSNEKLFLKEWLQVLTPITTALLNLEKDNCHFGILLPTLFTVRSRLDEFSRGDNIIYCKPLAKALLKGLEKRFVVMDLRSKEAVPAVIATCTHPHFKLRWLGEQKTVENLDLIRKYLFKAAEDHVQKNVDLLGFESNSNEFKGTFT